MREIRVLRLHSQRMLQNEEEVMLWLPISIVEDKPSHEEIGWLLRRARA